MAIIYKLPLTTDPIKNYSGSVETGEGADSAIKLPPGIEVLPSDNIVATVNKAVSWVKSNWKIAALGALAIFLLIRR